MATAFNDSVRNQIDAKRAQNERALQAMQLLASMNQTGATRYGSDRTLDAARLNAGNEATRLQNLMTLGREQYGSNERVAGLERGSRLEIAQLPNSPEARAFELEKIRAGLRPDPYMTRDIGQQNLESIALNDLAKSIAESVNIAIDREEAELLKDLPGLDAWDTEAKKRKIITDILTRTDKELGENRQLLEFDPLRKRYKPRVRALIPIPNGQLGPTPNGLPAVPPLRPNQSLMTPPSYGTPPMSYDNVPQLPPVEPSGAMAVPVTQPTAAVAPTNAVPQMLPTNPYLMNMARSLDFLKPMAVPAQAVVDAATYLPRQVMAIPGVSNALQRMQDLGSAALSGTVGRIGTRPAMPNGAPAGSVAVPVAPTNQTQIAADLARLATVGPVAPGTMSTNRATGMTYQFNGSTWQPMPR